MLPARAVFAFAAALVVMVLAPVSVHGAGDPYISGEHGYDISWPQCGDPPPRAGTFAVLGVNGGAPFSGNACLQEQYMDAPRSAPPSLYLNTGYMPDYRYLITPSCRGQAGPVAGDYDQKAAWAIGCSEAETSIGYAYALGASSISMWWLDVEILNKWSEDRTLNRFTLQGIVTRLLQTDLPVGIYSSEAMWFIITGTLAAPGNVSAEWNAAGSCFDPFSPLTRMPVWLGQHVYSHLDHDTAC